MRRTWGWRFLMLFTRGRLRFPLRNGLAGQGAEDRWRREAGFRIWRVRRLRWRLVERCARGGFRSVVLVRRRREGFRGSLGITRRNRRALFIFRERFSRQNYGDVAFARGRRLARLFFERTR